MSTPVTIDPLQWVCSKALREDPYEQQIFWIGPSNGKRILRERIFEESGEFDGSIDSLPDRNLAELTADVELVCAIDPVDSAKSPFKVVCKESFVWQILLDEPHANQEIPRKNESERLLHPAQWIPDVGLDMVFHDSEENSIRCVRCYLPVEEATPADDHKSFPGTEEDEEEFVEPEFNQPAPETLWESELPAVTTELVLASATTTDYSDFRFALLTRVESGIEVRHGIAKSNSQPVFSKPAFIPRARECKGISSMISINDTGFSQVSIPFTTEDPDGETLNLANVFYSSQNQYAVTEKTGCYAYQGLESEITSGCLYPVSTANPNTQSPTSESGSAPAILLKDIHGKYLAVLEEGITLLSPLSDTEMLANPITFACLPGRAFAVRCDPDNGPFLTYIGT